MARRFLQADVRFETKYESCLAALAILLVIPPSGDPALLAAGSRLVGKPFAIAAFIALAAVPRPAFAHGMPPAAAHGGRVLEANENWVELVLAGDRVQVYVLDETRKPVPASKLAGSVRVLVGGTPYKVKLSIGEANEMHAQLPVLANPKDAAVVSLLVGGQPASARYAPAT